MFPLCLIDVHSILMILHIQLPRGCYILLFILLQLFHDFRKVIAHCQLNRSIIHQ